jgi:hypothetical protein
MKNPISKALLIVVLATFLLLSNEVYSNNYYSISKNIIVNGFDGSNISENDSSNTVYIVNNNIKIINDFFLNNMYAIVALILLTIFLVWSAKIVFGRANLAKPPFDWRDRSGRHDSYGGEPW